MTKDNEQRHDPAGALLDEIAAKSRRNAAVAGGVASLSSSLWIVQAWFAAGLIGRLLTGTVSLADTLLPVAGFVIFGVLRHAGHMLAGRIAFRKALEIVAHERQAIVEAESLSSPYAAGERSSASIATLIGTKLDQLIPWMMGYRIASFKMRIVPIIILAAIFSISWAAGLILLIAGPLIPVFMALVGFAARDASEKHMAETGSLNAMLLEWLNAGTDIRLLNAREAVVGRFDAAADSLRARTMAVLRLAFLSSTVLELFSAIGIAMAAVYIGFSLLGTFSFGTYGIPLTTASGIFILLLVPDFFLPLRELAAAWHDRAAALAVAGEIVEVRRHQSVRMLGTGGLAQPLVGPAEIRTRNLVFGTSSGREIRIPDLVITQGEKIAITGESGAGKSTLLGLLSGMARPASGHIEVAGVALSDDTADAWRQRFAYVAQQPHMLNASLRANIALSGNTLQKQRLEDAIATAAARDIVGSLPNGMDTRLGENGSGVSGGEARRLTIARAIYKGADVIFADEPTADLDRETADRITDALISAASRGASLVVATHDPVFAARMDRQINLERTA